MVEEAELEIAEKEKQETHKNTEKMWKWIGVIISIILIIILIVWATNTENFKLFPFLAFLGSIIIIFVGLFFGVGIYRRMQELKDKKVGEGKLPPAITIEQASEIISKQMLNPRYCDYVQSWRQHRIYVVGKSQKCKILVVQLDTVYNHSPYQFYIINLNFPEMWSYICQEKYNPYEITRAVNNLAISPEDELEEKEIIMENMLTGNKVTTREKIKPKKKEKEEEKNDDGGLE